MPEMRIILVMEMREGKIYPMLVLEGGILHGTFLENILTYKGYVVNPFLLFHIHKQFHHRDVFQGRFLLLHDMLLVNFLMFSLLAMGIFVLVTGL